VSPIAYDLVLNATPSPGFVVTQGYGFPESTLEQTKLSVSTVFLSRRRGALLLRIEPEHDAAYDALSIGLSLKYLTTQGEAMEESFAKNFSGFTEDNSFEQDGVHKTVALGRLVSAMREAAELYATDRDAAISVLQHALVQLEDAQGSLNDPALQKEVAFSADLLGLMREGASQESSYGGF